MACIVRRPGNPNLCLRVESAVVSNTVTLMPLVGAGSPNFILNNFGPADGIDATSKGIVGVVPPIGSRSQDNAHRNQKRGMSSVVLPPAPTSLVRAWRVMWPVTVTVP